jgi:hypothetical protein
MRLQRTATVLFAAGLLAAGVAGGVATASHMQNPGGAPPRPTGAGQSDARPDRPALAADGQARAKSRAEEHKLVRQVLAGTGYRVDKVVPWYTADGSRLIGAVVDIRPVGPVKTDVVQWPSMRFGNAPDARVQEYVTTMSASNITLLTVFVDLVNDRVVAVEPDAGADRVLDPSSPTFDPAQAD